MAMPSATPSSSAGAWADSGADAEHAGPLRAWLYEVKPDGTSHLMGPSTGQPMVTVQPGGRVIRVCEWAAKHSVEPYTIIDKELVPRRGEH